MFRGEEQEQRYAPEKDRDYDGELEVKHHAMSTERQPNSGVVLRTKRGLYAE